MNEDLTPPDDRQTGPRQGLGDAENPWKLALESSGVGVWDWNLTTGEQTHSARLNRILGYGADEFGNSYRDFVARLHPDDIATLQAANAAYLERRSKGYAIDLRMRCKDGSWKWILSHGMAVSRDAMGQALRMIGTYTDITARKQAELELHELNQQLQQQTRLLQTTLASISQGIFMFDADGRLTTFNPRACELLDLSEEYLASRPSSRELTRYQTERGDFGPEAGPIDPQTRRDVMRVAADAHDVLPEHYLRVTPSGRTLEVTSRTLPDASMVRTFTDVSDYVRAEVAIRESEERWKLALDSTGDGVWDWHIQTGQEYFSKRLLEMYGFDEEEIRDHPDELDRRTHPADRAQLERDRQAHFDGLSPTYINEHRVRCKDGSWKWVLARGMVISRDDQGRPLRMIGTHTDISERKQSEALIRQQALFDALTGLPNRRMLRDRLEQEIKKCKRDGQQLAILFIDLDHFKEVNDTLGHDSGDLLLIEAARRIQGCLRESDTVARMGGDEFTVVLTELTDAAHIERILQSLLRVLGAVFQLGQEQAFVSASIGITMYPLDATEIDSLLKNADQALYVAKGAGRNRFSFFTASLQEAAQNRARLANDLRAGLSGQQFRVVYQPIVELATGSIHKAEALIRWQHPARGLISPSEFIPIAEASGLIVDIGDWVFQQAACQVLRWRAALDPRFQISVNKSPVQFHHNSDNHRPWITRLHELGLPGDSIAVEITEGLLLDSNTRVTDQLLVLRDAGIQVALDDFGTGYSSLSYLQKFDIDFIKIDQSFVRHLIPASTDLALCKAIIAMAHALGMKVIAEGVDTRQQRDLLAVAGCDFGQGFLFAQPMAAPAFEAFLQAR